MTVLSLIWILSVMVLPYLYFSEKLMAPEESVLDNMTVKQLKEQIDAGEAHKGLITRIQEHVLKEIGGEPLGFSSIKVTVVTPINYRVNVFVWKLTKNKVDKNEVVSHSYFIRAEDIDNIQTVTGAAY